MKAHRLVSFVAAFVLSSALPSVAQEKSWKGESVLYTKWPRDIEFSDVVDGKVVSFPFSGRLPLFVREDSDGSLRLHDGAREGWVAKADFVLAREALPYYTKRVEANAQDTFALYMRAE